MRHHLVISLVLASCAGGETPSTTADEPAADPAKAAEATGRNPGAFGKVFTTALIGMALAEGLAILAFFVVNK